eukprot:2572743-Alexandrium_andersonii.AAC.1
MEVETTAASTGAPASSVASGSEWPCCAGGPPSPTGSSVSAVVEIGCAPEAMAKRGPKPHQLRECRKCGEVKSWRSMRSEKVWKAEQGLSEEEWAE